MPYNPWRWYGEHRINRPAQGVRWQKRTDGDRDAGRPFSTWKKGDGLKHHFWESRLGNSPEAQTVLNYIGQQHARRTRKAYGDQWCAFLNFCLERNLCALPASTATVLRYIGHIGRRKRTDGRFAVQAKSLKQTFAAINNAHLDVGLEPPARGHIITAAKQGMQRDQAHWLAKHPDTNPQRTFLRIEVVEALLIGAEGLVKALSLGMDQDELELLADFAQVLFAVVTLDRNSTSNAIERRDITFHAGGGFTYLERVTKGKDADKEKRLREVPPEAFPRVQDVLRAFHRYHNQLQRNTRTGLFFGVGSRRVNLDAALRRALDSINISPPPGLCYSSHSCRKCATLVRAAGVALDDVTDWGGWSQLGGTVHTYIDKSYRLRGAALAFARELFGWLRHHDET